MDQLSRQVPPDRSLAIWAGAFLGGSALIGVALVLLALLAASPVTALAHPLATVLAIAAAVAFAASAFALTRLRSAAVQARRPLWYRSLTCNVIIVAIAVSLLGVKVGLAICIMELMAIMLHVVALSLPSLRT